MNYYEHHIGDYAEATSHLTFVEDAAYARMIRKYYASELPLPVELKAVQRLIGARTRDERDAVDTVLKEFFERRSDGWHNQRCDEEIARFNDKRMKASRSAKARWTGTPPDSEGNANASAAHTERISEPDANALPTQCEGNALQTPVTRLQSPVTRPEESSAHAATAVDARAPAPPADFKPTPEGEMALALRDRGVTVSSMHPTLIAWVSDGFTTQQAIDATELARMRKPYPEPIPPAYLDRILRQPQRAQLNGHKPEPATDWFKGTDHWKSMSQAERDEYEESKRATSN